MGRAFAFYALSNMRLIGICILVMLLMTACSEEVSFRSCDNETVSTPAYSLYSLAQANLAQNEPIAVDTLSSLNEVSGIAYSHVNENGLWAHSDSGTPEIIYLIDTKTAEIKGRYKLPLIENKDWEDIAVAPGPQAGQSYIYLADIGDNKLTRPYVEVYRFPEPLFAEAHRGKIIEYKPHVDTLRFQYPDKIHDAEAFMIDPATQDMYIITKRDQHSIIFLAPYPQDTKKINTLTPIITLPFNEVVAADISSDSRHILIKTYGKILYWKRKSGESLCTTLAEIPQEAPYFAEPQGESVAFGEKGYYTLSEYSHFIRPVLYFYPKK